MTTKFFVDTNILIYALDKKAGHKSKIATLWLDELAKREAIMINLQVINEFCHVAIRKMDHLGDAQIKDIAADFAKWGNDPVNDKTYEAAWLLRQRYLYSWFDSLLLASAHQLRCSFFLSEDLQNGHDVVGLTIINPFRAKPSDFLKRI